MKMDRFLKQFNWRFLLVRILVNALALAITAAVTPKIYFVDKSIGSWLLMAIMLGILNALLKPVLQFLTLPFIFATYGLVIVLVNTLILLLLSFLFPTRFAVDNLWWALLGGLLLGLLSSFLESLLGLTTPIVPDEPPELRRQVEEQARHVDWLAAARHEALQEHALAVEPAAEEVQATGTAIAASAGVEDIMAEAHTAETAVSDITFTEPAAAEPPPPVAKEEPTAPGVTEVETPDAAVPAEPEPAPDPGEQQEEDGS